MAPSYYFSQYSKTCLKRSLIEKTKIGFQGRQSLNAGQKYCRMLRGEHSAILSNFIKLPFVIKTCVLSIFEWPFYTGFYVYSASRDTLCLEIFVLAMKHGTLTQGSDDVCVVFVDVVGRGFTHFISNQ